MYPPKRVPKVVYNLRNSVLIKKRNSLNFLSILCRSSAHMLGMQIEQGFFCPLFGYLLVSLFQSLSTTFFTPHMYICLLNRFCDHALPFLSFPSLCLPFPSFRGQTTKIKSQIFLLFVRFFSKFSSSDDTNRSYHSDRCLINYSKDSVHVQMFE